MKKLLSIILMLSTCATFAQVGINTSSPQAVLHVGDDSDPTTAPLRLEGLTTVPSLTLLGVDNNGDVHATSVSIAGNNWNSNNFTPLVVPVTSTGAGFFTQPTGITVGVTGNYRLFYELQVGVQSPSSDFEAHLGVDIYEGAILVRRRYIQLNSSNASGGAFPAGVVSGSRVGSYTGTLTFDFYIYQESSSATTNYELIEGTFIVNQ